MSKGTRIGSEAKKYDGDRALKPVIQLTDNGGHNRHLGSYAVTFAGEGSKLIYVSDRDGAPNLYRMDLYNFESTQLTDGKGLFGGGAWYCGKSREVFFWQKTALKAVHIDTLDEREIYDEGYQGEYLTVSCDGRFVAFAAKCESVPGLGEEMRGRSVIMVVSARGEGAHPAVDVPFPVEHVQFSPVEPDMLLYSWEGAGRDVPQRVWATDTSGLAGGPVGRQNPNEARSGEFFTSSGERVGFHGHRYHTRNADGIFFVEETAWIFGLVKPDGTNENIFECHGPTGQCQMNHAEDLFVCSQGGAGQLDNQTVALLRPVGKGGAVFDPLFYHGAGAHAQWLCPQFRPGDEDVIFTTDFSGQANIYLASVK